MLFLYFPKKQTAEQLLRTLRVSELKPCEILSLSLYNSRYFLYRLIRLEIRHLLWNLQIVSVILSLNICLGCGKKAATAAAPTTMTQWIVSLCEMSLL